MPEKFFKKLQSRINSKLSGRTKNRIEIVILKDIEGRMKFRIFNKGLATDRRRIGNYSTKPMLIGASSFFNTGNASAYFDGIKGDKDQKWRTVRTPKGKRRLAVLEGGYKAYRKLTGRRNDRVDLQLQGNLFRDIQVAKSTTGSNVLGFLTDKQRIIAEANEKRFGKEIFAISTTENKAIDKAWIREIDAILKGL